MVLFPIALIWVAVVLYVIIVRHGSDGEPEQPGPGPRRFRRPPLRRPPTGPRPARRETVSQRPDR